MTLRKRILLLGILSIVGMGFALWGRVNSYNQQLKETDILMQNVAVVHAASALTHELQKERGLRTIHEDEMLLAQQKLRTDQAMKQLAETGKDVTPFRRELVQLRAMEGDEYNAHFLIRNAYTVMIGELIEMIRHLKSEPEARLFARNISVHTHLLSAKEHLGKIRATVGYWLKYPADNYAYQDINHFKSLYDEQVRLFQTEASEDLKQRFNEKLRLMPFKTVKRSLDEMDATRRPPTHMSVFFWWSTSTTAINQLKEIEDLSLQHIETESAKRSKAVRNAMYFEMAVTAVFCAVIMALVISTVISLLRTLAKSVRGIERISGNSDFSSRLDVTSKDEIGYISLHFNKLLDVAERLLKEKEELAVTDQLTGAYNRLRFAQIYDEEVLRKQRHPGPMSLIIFDLDHFKRVNDTYGHNVGDEVLQSLVVLVKNEVRTTDVLVRWGGEEFVLFLRDEDCRAAMIVAEKLRVKIADYPFPEVGRVTSSFGVCAWKMGDTMVSLVERADQALYKAKQAGRNCVVCFDSLEKSG